MGSAAKLKKAAAFVPATELEATPKTPSWLAIAFGCDYRALAIFRISLGFLTLADLWVRMGALLAHYTDFGILPRGTHLDLFANAWEFSFHNTTGNAFGMLVLFGLHAAVAVALIIGWRTRFVSFLAWAFVVSLHNRNPVILHSGDVVFRMLLFWAMFLPLGARASVDAALAPKNDACSPDWLVNVATAAVLLQIFEEYFFAALFKGGDEWHSAGNAVYYALSVEQFTTSIGIWFRETFRPLLPFLTRSVWWFELLGPFFLFAPFRRGWIRLVFVALFAAMHLNFEIMLGIGTFPFICIVGLVPFLPTAFLDRVERWVRGRERPGRLVHAPGVLAAERGTTILRELLFLEKTPVLSAPAAKLERALVNRGEWLGDWAFEDATGALHNGPAALFAAMEASPVFRPVGRLCRTWPLRAGVRAAYRFVVRVATPRADRWFPLAANEYRLGRFKGGAVVSAALFCACWNVDALQQGTTLVPRFLKPVANVFRLDQRWNMFSRPIQQDGWLVYDGKLQNGKPFDLKTGKTEAPSYDRPKLLSAEYSDERWQKYLMNLQNGAFEKHRLLYGRYLCRKTNVDRVEGEKLESFDLVFVFEKLTGEGRTGPTRQVLWHHRCFDPPAPGALNKAS